MSGSSDEEISNADRDGYQGGGSDADDDDDDDDYEVGKIEQRRKSGRGMGKAKKVVLHQFTKAKNKLRRIRSRKPLLPPNARTTDSGKMISGADGSGYGRGCRFCFSRPKVLESPNESPTSDPNDPNFTYAMLKTLIDKNDFYSRECNTHLD